MAGSLRMSRRQSLVLAMHNLSTHPIPIYMLHASKQTNRQQDQKEEDDIHNPQTSMA
jgi:hypothetical protein